MSVSISNLEKRVRALAAKLEKDGWEILNIYVFKSGQGNPYASSRVELEIERYDTWHVFNFEANGYGPRPTWKEMKAYVLEHIGKNP